jgi:2-succinyl-6-hydroxy-2,4-cyclohexadiene-1-carboxylate synthase
MARVVLVHGFTQTRHSWDAVARLLEPDHEVLALDAPGHGELAGVALDLWQGARLVAQQGGRAVYAGYSMGGRLCLHVALAHPDHVDALVLLGATAGIRDDAERAVRRREDDARAMHIEHVGVDAFLREWLAQPLFASLPADARGLTDRLANTAEGLAASLRLAGTGAQDPLWDRLEELEMPVLFVAGERDDKFLAIAREMASGVGVNAHVALVPRAGHAAHLERPDAFAAIVRDFLH